MLIERDIYLVFVYNYTFFTIQGLHIKFELQKTKYDKKTCHSIYCGFIYYNANKGRPK